MCTTLKSSTVVLSIEDSRYREPKNTRGIEQPHTILDQKAANESLAKRLLESESELNIIRQASRIRSREFTKAQQSKGYTRRSFWTKLSRTEWSLLTSWIRRQELKSLLRVICLDASLTTLLDAYDRSLEAR